jgi:hypothetical protein
MKLVYLSLACLSHVPTNHDGLLLPVEEGPASPSAVLNSEPLDHWYRRVASWGHPGEPRRYAIAGSHRWFGEPFPEVYEAFIAAELKARSESTVEELAVGHALRLADELDGGILRSRVEYGARVGAYLDFRETLSVWSEGWQITEHVSGDDGVYDMTHTYLDGVALIQRGPQGELDHQELVRSETEHQAATGSWMAAQDMFSRLTYAIVAADAGGFADPSQLANDRVEFSIPVFDLAGAVEDFAAILPADAFWIPGDYHVLLHERGADIVYEGRFVAQSSGALIFAEQGTVNEYGVPVVMSQQVHDPSRSDRLLKRSTRVFRDLGSARTSKPLELVDRSHPILDSFYRGGVEFSASEGDVANQLGAAIEGSRLAVSVCNAGRPDRGDFSLDWTVHPVEAGTVTEFTYPKSRLDAGAIMIPLTGGEEATDFWSKPSCSCIETRVVDGGAWLSIARSGGKELLSELSVTLGWTLDGEPHQSTLVMLSEAEDDDLASRFVPLPLRAPGETVELSLPVDSILGSGVFSTPLEDLEAEVDGALAIVNSQFLEEVDGVPRVLRLVVGPRNPQQLGALTGRLVLRGVDGVERGDLILSGTWTPASVEFDAESTLRFGLEGDAVLRWSPWFPGECQFDDLPAALEGSVIERRVSSWRFSPARKSPGAAAFEWEGTEIRFLLL